MSSLFLTHLATQNDLIGPSSGTMGQGITILYWWGPLEAILGHFRVIFGPEQEAWACLEHILSLFLTRLATQKDLNGPKSGIVGQDITIL